MGGEVIRIAAGSDDHINALDMVEGYGDGGNPVIDKSEFVLSLFEQLDKGGMGPKQKSIIDRCVENVYRAFKKNVIYNDYNDFIVKICHYIESI